jgi:hypothetical protein
MRRLHGFLMDISEVHHGIRWEVRQIRKSQRSLEKTMQEILRRMPEPYIALHHPKLPCFMYVRVDNSLDCILAFYTFRDDACHVLVYT